MRGADDVIVQKLFRSPLLNTIEGQRNEKLKNVIK